MEEHPNAQQVRLVIEQRLSRYRVLFFDCMTPSLKKELRNAIQLHSEVLQLPQPKVGDIHRVLKRLTELDDLDDHLMEHWAKVHRDFVSRSSLLVNMALFQAFIAAKLLEDYTGKASSPSPWVLSQASIVEQQSTSAQQTGDKPSAYQTHVVLPVEEILLDPKHVGEKLKAAATPQKHPGGDIQRLIDKCDWPSLAATLVKDRELTVELFQQSPLDPEAFDSNTSKKVLRKIDDITTKYFTDLSTPSKYTLNNHAVQKSAGQASGNKNKDPTSPDIMLYREEPTLVAGARSLFDKLTNGLGLAGAGTSLSSLGHNVSHTSLDDRTRLIDARKKNV